MNLILKLIDLIGGLDGIKKALDGKKTYISAAAGILLASGWCLFQIYLFSQKQIDANKLLEQLTGSWAIISVQATFVFQRMAQAKTIQAIKSQAIDGDNK